MKRVKTKDLVPGHVLAEDVYNYNGQMILPRGLVLTDKVITRLEYYSILSVRVEDEQEEVAEKHAIPNPDPSENQSSIITNNPDFKKFKAAFENSISDFKSSINDIVTLNSPIDTDSLIKSTESLITQASNSSLSTMDMVQNMRQYDDLTFAHSMNVALIANVFAHWLKFSEEETNLLTLCGLLHDIGKLKISDSIIKKPDKLTSDEYRIIKTHTIEGYNILKDKNVNVHISNCAIMHHEKCDGSGYPFGITNDRIDNYAKIIAIVDVYDAMTSARIYRGPMCPFRVIEIFENEGLQKYDARYILTFLENVCNTYLHYSAKLSDGRIGKIVFINKAHLSKPIVQCEDTMVDLSKEKDLHVDEIL